MKRKIVAVIIFILVIQSFLFYSIPSKYNRFLETATPGKEHFPVTNIGRFDPRNNRNALPNNQANANIAKPPVAPIVQQPENRPAFGKKPFFHVHIIPHSHCDAGWLKTMEEYYQSSVKRIISSIGPALTDHPHRKFNWVEIGFFDRWWKDQTNETKQQYKNLVKNGQLEFVQGGWVSHDEASVNFIQAVNQMSLGHQWLQKNVDESIKPNSGWQIDAFGLSKTSASLFSQMCFNSHAGWRVKTMDASGLTRYFADKSIEFVWRSSSSIGQNSDILMHILQNGYSNGDFQFDSDNFYVTKSVINNTSFQKQAAAHLEEIIRLNYAGVRTNNIMWLWGTDFSFINATINFENMDVLINEINSNPDHYRFKLTYSTVSEYFKTLHATGTRFPVKARDFFPYQPTLPNSWVGYFTSRPTFKRYCRSTDALQRSAEMIYSITRLLSEESDSVWETRFASIYEMRKVHAIMQHHDAITGTSVQHVMDDYVKMLDNAHNDVRSILKDIVTILSGTPMDIMLESIPELSKNSVRQLTLFNSLPWKAKQFYEVGLKSPFVQVITSGGSIISSIVTNPSFIQFDESVGFIVRNYEMETEEFSLIFEAEVPALGYRNYYLIEDETRTFEDQREIISEYIVNNLVGMESVVSVEMNDDFFLRNELLQVKFNTSTGRINQIVWLDDEQNEQYMQVNQHHLRYKSNDTFGNHYTFTHIGPPIELEPSKPLQFKLFKSPLMEELIVRSSETPAIIMKIRLYNNHPFVEIEEKIGPPGIATDIVTRFNTKLDTKGTFYTDSSGIEMVMRIFERRNTIPGNYFPAIYSSYIKDQLVAAPQQLTILMDTPHGVTSPDFGCLEIMLHRANEQIKGNGERLDDRNIATLRSRILVRNSEHKARQHHALRFNFPLLGFISEEIPYLDKFSDVVQPIESRSFLSEPLPNELFLSNFEHFDGAQPGKIVMRVINIMQSDGVDEFAAVALRDKKSPSILLTNFVFGNAVTLDSVEERTLSMNQRPEECKRDHWHFETEPTHPDKFGGMVAQSNEDLRLYNPITINPIEIRSFFLDFTKQTV